MVLTGSPIHVTKVDDFCTRSLLVHNEDLMMIRFDFIKGGVGAPHSHKDHTQVGYILKGKFELICGDKSSIVVSGDSYMADKDVIHGVVALEDGAILDVFTPDRKEFL